MLRDLCVFPLIALLIQPVLAADEVQLKWSELGAIAIGHDVRLVVPGGAVLRGAKIGAIERRVRRHNSPSAVSSPSRRIGRSTLWRSGCMP